MPWPSIPTCTFAQPTPDHSAPSDLASHQVEAVGDAKSSKQWVLASCRYLCSGKEKDAQCACGTGPGDMTRRDGEHVCALRCIHVPRCGDAYCTPSLHVHLLLCNVCTHTMHQCVHGWCCFRALISSNPHKHQALGSIATPVWRQRDGGSEPERVAGDTRSIPGLYDTHA